jgi:ferritin-like metal-binding protein YciE
MNPASLDGNAAGAEKFTSCADRRLAMSPDTARSAFVLELRNAHAMERQSHELMKWQAVRLADYPDMEERIRKHMAETNAQLRRLEKCLEALNERPSILKDTALSILGNLTATSNAMGEDEILKNMFSNYAFEHYELVVYKSLVKMAQELGLEEAKSLLLESRGEEQRMASWIDRRVETVTANYLERIDQLKHAAALG